MNGCNDCNRTELFRRAVAEAGHGLPGIEPGMPLPAGTGMTRQAFLSRSAGLALAVYGGGALTAMALDDGIARAASERASGSQKILVSVFLQGGIDGLNVLFPAGDPMYYELRPNIALQPSVGIPYAEDDRLFWHPAAKSISTLYGEGKVTVIPSIGYFDSDLSHFTMRHYWEVGATDASLRTGWLGRYLDTVGTQDNPLQGLCLDIALQPSLATAKVPVATIQAADQYTYVTPGLPPHPLESSIFQEAANIGAAFMKSKDSGFSTAGEIAVSSHHLSAELKGFAYGFNSPVAYPVSTNAFPHQLAGLAAMIAAGLPLNVVTITAPGSYDTHANEASALQSGLQLTSDTLLAFQRDLESRGIADQVLIHVWSEFGRRAAENASAGTDHGVGNVGFLIGTQASGHQIGGFPGVTGGLDVNGNLLPTADYREIYSSLLAQWLDADPTAILPNAAAYQQQAILK